MIHGHNIVQTLSKHGPDIVLKIGLVMSMFLIPNLFTLENYRVLAGLKVLLGNTWSKPGLNMATKNKCSIDMLLGPR